MQIAKWRWITSDENWKQRRPAGNQERGQIMQQSPKRAHARRGNLEQSFWLSEEDSPRFVRMKFPRRRIFHARHHSFYFRLYFAAPVRRYGEKYAVDEQGYGDRDDEEDHFGDRLLCVAK